MKHRLPVLHTQPHLLIKQTRTSTLLLGAYKQVGPTEFLVFHHCHRRDGRSVSYFLRNKDFGSPLDFRLSSVIFVSFNEGGLFCEYIM